MQPLPEHNLELVVAGVLKNVFWLLLGLFCEFFYKILLRLCTSVSSTEKRKVGISCSPPHWPNSMLLVIDIDYFLLEG